MTIVVDASALVAMVVREPEAELLGRIIDRHDRRLCSALGIWEAARAVAHKRQVTASLAMEAIRRLLTDLALEIVPIGEHDALLALKAHDLYGKGTGHPAKLNMGDCFAYACAKAHGARLLYKGDDFARTDLA